MTRRDSGYRVEDRWHERPEVPEAAGCGTDKHDAEREPRDVLLELNTAVHRDEDVVVPAHALQKRGILDSCPATADDRFDVVAV